MKEITAIMVLLFGLSLGANAEIYKWVDEDGNVHYSDMPANEYAKKAELVSYSSSQRSASTSSRTEDADSEETSAEGVKGEDAQAYYCEQAKDIYNSYVGAPRLYKTSEDGQREYLSDAEMAATIADAEASMTEWCS